MRSIVDTYLNVTMYIFLSEFLDIHSLCNEHCFITYTLQLELLPDAKYFLYSF